MENTKKRMDYCLVARCHGGKEFKVRDENGPSKVKFGKFELPKEAIDAGYTDVWLEPIDRAIRGNVRKELKCVIMTVKTGDKYGNSRGQVSRMRTDESA